VSKDTASRGAGSPGQGGQLTPLKFEIGVKKLTPRLCRTGDFWPWPLLKNGSRAPDGERRKQSVRIKTARNCTSESERCFYAFTGRYDWSAGPCGAGPKLSPSLTARYLHCRLNASNDKWTCLRASAWGCDRTSHVAKSSRSNAPLAFHQSI